MRQSGKVKNLLPVLLIAISVIVLLLGIVLRSDAVLYGFFMFFGGLFILYLLFFNKRWFFFLIAFTIPLSIQLKIGGGSVISFPSELMASLLAVYLLLRNLKGVRIERRLLFHPLTILLLTDLGLMIVSSIFSSIPDFSFKRTFIRIIYITVYFFLAAELLRNRKEMAGVFIILAAGMVYPVISSMIQHAAIGFGAHGSYQMTLPFFADHTIYGAFLAMLTPVLIATAYNRKLFGFERKHRILLWVLAAFILLSLFLSYSRAAWLSVMLLAPLALLIRFKVRFYVLLIGLLTICAIVLLNFDRISDYAIRNDARSNSKEISEHLQSVSNIQTDASNKERINRWKCAVRMFYDRPVFGFGPGTYQYNYGKYQVRAEMTRISTFTGNRGHAHSEYMTYLSEEGLPGFLIFLAIVLFAVYTGMKLVYRAKEPADRRMALAVLLSLVTFIIHGVFNAFLDIDKMAMPVFVCMAILVRLDADRKRNAQILSGNNQILSEAVTSK